MVKKIVLTAWLLGGISLLFISCSDTTGPGSSSVEAVISYSPDSPGVGDKVTLDASASTDSEGESLSYEWELSVPIGSSTTLSETTTSKPTFIPDVEGDYTATVTASNTDGQTDEESITVTVTAPTGGVVEVSRDITSDETWTAELYRVTGPINVEQSATLTIEAGVTVEFESNAGIRVNSDNAALVVEGTETDSVTFTGVQKSPGFWRGLAFDSSNPLNKLDYTVVEYGGYESWGYIDEAANVSLRDNGSNVTITNSTFRSSSSFGLYAEESTSLPNFSNNTFTENEVLAAIPTTLMGALDSGSTYVGNNNDHVLVESQDVSNDMNISSIDVPYRIENNPHIKEDAQVTIEAGTTLEFMANAGMRVNSDNAALMVNGESGSPVLFTGVQKSPGFWRGLAFDSSNPLNKLDYAVVEYGGYESWAYIDEAANVSLRDNGSNVTITNSTSRYSSSFGLYAESSTKLPNFSNNTFTGNEVSAAIAATLMGALDSGSTYVGNNNDHVLVESQDISSDMTISSIDVPYRIENNPHIKGDAQVTIEAGTTLEFKANAGMRVNSDNATLIVNGESGSPVLFTGVEKSKGFWLGIAFDSTHPDNKMDYAVVEYGGSASAAYINEAANVAIRDGKRLTLTNSVMRYSGGYGAYADDGTSADITYNGNTYSNNTSGDNNFGDSGI